MRQITAENWERFIDQLIQHEGMKRDADGLHKAYRCTAGALTIGYGHNLDANPIPGIGADSRLTEDEARDILDEDVRAHAAELEHAFPWVRDLDEIRYLALLDMAFNMGVPTLSTFKSTLQLIWAGSYAKAADQALQSRWAKQVKGRAHTIAEQLRTGEWA